MGDNTTTGEQPVKLSPKQKAARSLELRNRGWSYADIAKEVGYKDHTGALRAVERMLVATVREPAEQVRRHEVERLDMMLRTAFDVLYADHLYISGGRVVKDEVYEYDEDDEGNKRVRMEKDEDSGEWRPVVVDFVPLHDLKPKLDAIKTIIKLMERRAKLLGLDAPTKFEPVHPDLVRQEIKSLADDMGLDPSRFDAEIAALLESALED